tara:strand:- start:663 stop:1229 length:567 start_codon:yes stop_codon:yes gene_type:complete
METDFYIKNMVCDRCIKVLSSELKAENIELLEIELGRVKLNAINSEVKGKLISILENNGFLLIDDLDQQLVEQVKVKLIKLFQILPLEMKGKLSEYLARNLHKDYSKISKVFSANEQTTIEKYFIKLKIEKAKELMQAKELNFTGISQLLDYNNLTHLSNQFRTETGMSLTEYKSLDKSLRSPLDGIL